MGDIAGKGVIERAPSVAEVERVFDVVLQGQQVLTNFDIARQARSDGGVVKEFGSVAATSQITLELKPSAGQPVICGIEVIAP